MPAFKKPLACATLLTALVAGCAPVASMEPRPRPPPEVRQLPALRADGRWVLDRDGTPVPYERDGRSRGLQPSGMVHRGGLLWCVGDQRSQVPGTIYRIDPRTARLTGPPIRLEPGTPSERSARDFDAYGSIPNPDIEGLCLDPLDPSGLLAVTESRMSWIVGIRVGERPDGERPDGAASDGIDGGGERAPSATIVHLEPLRFPDGVSPWRDDANFRFEGIAASDDGKTIYLAFERARDHLPRICVGSLERFRARLHVDLEVLPVRFDRIPSRADKPGALLNINDIQFLRWKGRALLVGVLRDQERLLILDAGTAAIVGLVDLDLRDPSGTPITWVSPEALAIDAAADRLWIINDPDSERGNYKARDAEVPEGMYAAYVPLLFELELSRLPLPGPGPSASTPSSGQLPDGSPTAER